MTTRKPPIKVVPGQIWADKYYGSKGRTVRVLEVGPTHATVEVATEAPGPGSTGSTIGRQTRVSYDHRGLNGYRLESEPKGGPMATDRVYDPDTATARQIVEHWRATAVDLKARQDKLAWTLVEAFANQVLRAMDRETS